MSVSFSYDDVGEHVFGRIHRPVAQVLFRSQKAQYWVKTWLIVDTGADFTILPRYLARDMEISLEHDCTKDVTHGVGGEQAIYFCKKKISAKIGDIQRDVPLAFFDSNETPALLGRLGFMETMDVCFRKTHAVSFEV